MNRSVPLLILSVLVVAACVPVFGQTVDGVIQPNEYPHSIAADGERYVLSWGIRGDTAFFGIRARTSGWVAVGFDPTNAMENADMIIGWVGAGGAVSVEDSYATGPYGPHVPDEELGGTDDLEAYAGTESGDFTTIEFARGLSTGDAYDRDIRPDGGNALIWAFGPSDDLEDIHASRGSGILLADGRKASLLERLGPLLLSHIVLLSLSFLVMVVGMLVSRYLKRTRWWVRVHRAIGIAGASLGAAGVATGVYMIATTTGIHLRVVHSWFGAFAILVILTAPFFGQAFLRAKKDLKPRYRAAHRWTGRAALLLMLATIVLGLFRAGIL